MGLFGPKKLKEEDFYFSLDYEFENTTQENFSPEAFTFRHTYTVYVQMLALNWFGTDPVTLRTALETSKGIPVSSIFVHSGVEDDFLGEPKVDRSLLNTDAVFKDCEIISWSDSQIALRWQKALERHGVQLSLHGSPQDMNIQVISGKWKLFDGITAMPIMGEAWKNKKTGKEFVYWFIDALSRSRKLEVSPKEFPSHKFFIPEFLQRAGYLSETLFPSTMMVVRDRMMQFGVTDQAQLPSIAIDVQSDYYVLGVNSNPAELNARMEWSPETTRYGYIIDDQVPFETVDQVIFQVVDALPKVASILADGFSHWNFDEEIGFQDALITDLYRKNAENLPNYRIGILVPSPLYVPLVERTNLSYALLEQLARDEKQMGSAENEKFYREGLFGLVNIGVGTGPVHAMNSLYFRVANRDDLSKRDPQARQNITDLHMYFSDWNFDKQNANALSNLAMLQLNWGDFDRALKSANLALELYEKPLTQKYQTEYTSNSEFYPIIIKWEVMITKARVLILLDDLDGAKEALKPMVAEATAMNYPGEELIDAQAMLAAIS